MPQCFHVRGYFLWALGDYLTTTLCYKIREGKQRTEIISGAAYGSFILSDFWNASYNYLLHLEIPKGSNLVKYVDNVAVLIATHLVGEVQQTLGMVM